MRPIDANWVVKEIIAERDKTPVTKRERYTFGKDMPDPHGMSVRAGLRKALRCVENAPTLDVEPVRRGGVVA